MAATAMEMDAPPAPQQEQDQEELGELPLVRNVTLRDGRTACLSLSRIGAAGAVDAASEEEGCIGLKVKRDTARQHLLLSMMHSPTRSHPRRTARKNTGALGRVMGRHQRRRRHRPEQSAGRAGVGGTAAREGEEGGAAPAEAAGPGAGEAGSVGGGRRDGGRGVEARGEAAPGEEARLSPSFLKFACSHTQALTTRFAGHPHGSN